MTWHVTIAGPAQKDFAKLPLKEQARARAVFVSMQADPFQGDLKRLKGRPNAWRRRVGNYRILFDLDFDQRHVVILAILRRTTTTYD
jgi:mRNA-degrading endonuclease RelE of RelBE toxin-antitoxin system